MSEGAPNSDSVIDLRGRLLPVGDQGRRGTCVAFAVTAIHESDCGLNEVTGAPEDLAEEVLFWGAKQVDGDASDGTRFTSANRALQRWGQPAEHFWPYDDGRRPADASYTPPAEAVDPANCRRTTLLPLALDVARLRLELAADHPVALGIRVWDEFRLAASEPLPTPDPSALYPTGHAVVAVGHDPARSAILIRNSWGLGWGNAGHLWIDDGLLGLARSAWIVEDQVTVAADAPPLDEVLI
jgi:C1A family cysteine protease